MENTHQAPKWKTLLAFGIIYFVWGATFFAIRVGVREVPSCRYCAMRFVAAGLLVYLWALAQKAARYSPRWQRLTVLGRPAGQASLAVSGFAGDGAQAQHDAPAVGAGFEDGDADAGVVQRHQWLERGVVVGRDVRQRLRLLQAEAVGGRPRRTARAAGCGNGK